MSRRRFRSTLVACVFVSSLSSSALAQSDRDRSVARSAADAGADAFDAGHYAEALELFERAESVVDAPTHLLFIARCQEKLGKLVEAHETYLKLLHDKLPPDAPTAFKNAAVKGEAELNALEARLPYVTISVRGDERNRAVVSLDGHELPAAAIGIPIPANPGTHVFAAHTDRARSSDVSVTLREGAKQAVELSLTQVLASSPGQGGAPFESGDGTPQAAADSGSRSTSGQTIVGYVTAGVGVVLAGVGTGFLVSSLNTRAEANDLFAACDGTKAGCSAAQRAEISKVDGDADKSRNVAIGGFALGGAAIVTGVVLILTGGSHGSEQGLGEPHVRLIAGPRFLGAAGTF